MVATERQQLYLVLVLTSRAEANGIDYKPIRMKKTNITGGHAMISAIGGNPDGMQHRKREVPYINLETLQQAKCQKKGFHLKGSRLKVCCQKHRYLL
jgi:hypothetical protein